MAYYLMKMKLSLEVALFTKMDGTPGFDMKGGLCLEKKGGVRSLVCTKRLHSIIHEHKERPCILLARNGAFQVCTREKESE
jgi:hypothetical protein